MKTLFLNFHDELAAWLGGLPESSIATREITFEDNGVHFRLSAVCEGEYCHIALRDDLGNPVPDFEVRIPGERRCPLPGDESVTFARAQLATLHPLSLYVHGHHVCRLLVFPQEDPTLSEADNTFAARAWARLYQDRTCPPASELASNDDRARRHLTLCRSCSDIMASGPEMLSLFEQLCKDAPAPAHPRPAPGQIWSLNPELAGWNSDEEYLRPPLAMVVSTGQTLRVVPCCPAEDLAEPSDLLLGHGLGFAEYWNVMMLPATALGACLMTLDASLADAVANRAGQAMPRSASLWRRYMQDQESSLAREMERRALTLAMRSNRVAQTSLADAFLDSMATLRQWFFPPAPAMAMARGAGRTYQLYRLQGDVSERTLTISSWVSDDAGLHISGSLDLPDGNEILHAAAILEVQGILVDPSDLVVNGQHFMLDFPPCPGATEDELRFIVVTS